MNQTPLRRSPVRKRRSGCFPGFVTVMMFGFGACNAPPNPEKDARVALERKGYPEETIGKVVRKESLGPEVIRELGRSKDLNVRYLVAANPSLDSGGLDAFIGDREEFVRAGVASNGKMSRGQMERLFHDSSFVVTAALARNPAVPEEMLIRLFDGKKAGMSDFTINPRCPRSLMAEIYGRGDATAHCWLGINPNTPPEMRRRLEESSDPVVRDFIRNNAGYWKRRNH